MYILILILLTVHKHIKDIRTISNRQFQMRIQNKLQLLHNNLNNNNPEITIKSNIQSSSQVCFKIKVCFVYYIYKYMFLGNKV
jgi:hypothetical protein